MFISHKKIVLLSICLLFFVGALSGSLILTILPALLNDQLYGLMIYQYGLSKSSLYGLTLAMFPLASIVGIPVVSHLADICPKKIIIFAGGLGIVIVDILSIIAVIFNNIWIFCLARFIAGFLSGIYAVSMALIIEISTDNLNKTANFKLCTAVSILGGVFGPGLAMLCTDVGYNINPFIVPFVIVLLMNICNFSILWYTFNRNVHPPLFSEYKENISLIKDKLVHQKDELIKELFYSLFVPIFQNNIRLLCLGLLLIQCGIGLYTQSLSLFFVTTFMYTPSDLSIIIVTGYVLNVLGIYALHPVIKACYKGIYDIICYILVTIILFMSYAYYITFYSITDLRLYEIISLLVALIVGSCIPCINLIFVELFASSAQKSNKGKMMGYNAQIAALAASVSGILSCKLLFINYALLVTTASGILILGGLILTIHFTNHSIRNRSK